MLTIFNNTTNYCHRFKNKENCTQFGKMPQLPNIQGKVLILIRLLPLPSQSQEG